MPDIAIANIGGSGFDVNWSKPFGAQVPVLNYQVIVDDNSDFSSPEYTTTPAIGNTIFSDSVTGLGSNTTFYVKVKSTHTDSSTNDTTVLEVATIVPPVDLTVSKLKDTSFTLTWEANGGSEFEVDLSSDNFATSVTGYPLLLSTTTTDIASLTPSTTYKYRIRTKVGATYSIFTDGETTLFDGSYLIADTVYAHYNWTADSRFQITTVSTTGGQQLQDIDRTTAETEFPMIKDYTISQSVRSDVGESFTISVTTRDNSNVTGWIAGKIWIDWNENGDWNDSGDEVAILGDLDGNQGGQEITHEKIITVPAGVSGGLKRMRIRVSDAGQIDSTFDAHGVINNGGTAQDYIVEIGSNPPPIPVASSASNVTSTGFTANWEPSSGATRYRLFVNGSDVYNGSETSFDVTTAITTEPSVSYTVQAWKDPGGYSINSNIITVSLPAPSVYGGSALEIPASPARVEADFGTVGAGVSTFTWETWTKIDSNDEFGTLMARRIDHNNQISISQTNSNGFRFAIGTDERKSGVVQNLFETGKWFHIAMVYDGNGIDDQAKLKVYFNGIAVTINFDEPNFPATTAEFTAEHKFTIGSEPGALDNTFQNGSIDEIRIWSTARTAEEIFTNMHSKVANDTIGLLAYYEFTSDPNTVDSEKADSTGNYNLIGTLTSVASGAMINPDINYANSAYLWDASLTGLPVNGVTITSSTAIDKENTGLFYGLPDTPYNVLGTTAQDLPSGFTYRLLRVWDIAELYANITGSISFDQSIVGTIPGDVNTHKLLYRSNQTRANRFTDTGATATIVGDIITFSGVDFDSGQYTLGDNMVLTPAFGITVSQEGTTLSWSVGDEIGVVRYLLVDVNGNEVAAPVEYSADVNGSYTVQVPAGIDVQLVVVDNNGYEQSFMPADGNLVKAVYNLVEGWNLIAMPGANADIFALEAAISGEVWGWNGTSYEAVTTPTVGNAVWVNVLAPVQVIITAEKVMTELTLKFGWNMVGPTENIAIPVKAHTVYGWNEKYQQIIDESAGLMQGVGYWIFVL